MLLQAPTDSVKDRLAAYFYWGDEQGLEQALLVAKKHKISLKTVEDWAKHEGFLPLFHNFVKKLEFEEK